MSEASRPTPQEFEKVLAAASTAQASFEEENLPLTRRIQRFLHLYPTTVPFVVLVLGLLLGCTVNYSHFVTGSNLSTVLTKVTIIGILGIAQTLVILTAGIDLTSRPDQPGKRGFDVLNSAFFDNDLMLRTAGDTLALTPPLIISEEQIGEIVEKLAKVIRAVA